VRLLKLAFISLLFLFVIVTGISLLIPSHIRLVKVITIRPEKDSIFALIKNKDQWTRWHPSFLNGANADMLSKITATIVSEKDSVLLMQWQQKGKKDLDMGWQLSRSNNIDPATLQWFMDFKTSWYPWQKIGSLFYENNYGTMMERGLLNIKNEIEN
jgi:hypothetical protein